MPIRGAIYTRQSVDPRGELSSCQVQFELCAAYIQSLRSPGYEVVAERFDGTREDEAEDSLQCWPVESCA